MLKKYRYVIVFRALIGYYGIQGQWSSVKYMPVAIANCLNQLAPIVCSFYGYLILNEKLSKWDVIGFIVAFTGVIVLNNPLNFGMDDDKLVEVDKNKRIYSPHELFIGTLWAISGILLGGFVSICMRYMREGIHFSISPFWFAAGCSFWSPIFHSI